MADSATDLDRTELEQYDKADEYDEERERTFRGEWKEYLHLVKDEPRGVGVGVDLHEVQKATRAIQEEKKSGKNLKCSVYVTGISSKVTEMTLEEEFAVAGKIKLDQRFLTPAISVYMNRKTHLPRGDALIEFEDEEAALAAVRLGDGLFHMGNVLSVRLLDENTQKILTAQIYDRSKPWVCRKCKETNNFSRVTCQQCRSWRPAPNTDKVILPDDWLCDSCLTNNRKDQATCPNCEKNEVRYLKAVKFGESTNTITELSGADAEQEEAAEEEDQEKEDGEATRSTPTVAQGT